jgi:DNA-binding transcriptional regulator YiaG
MEIEELKAARRELGMNRAELAKRLRTPYRSYVNWERGDRPIPGVCETAIELLLRHDRLVMQAIKEKLSTAK